MIIVNIKNGLGNQMFQYAFGKVIEWKYGVNVCFDLLREDISTTLVSDLDVFTIDPIVEMEPTKRKPYLPFSVRMYRDNKKYIKYVYFKLRRRFQKKKIITEPLPSQYLSVFDTLDVQRDYYFLGFWQNARYFEGYESRVRNFFEPSDRSVLDLPLMKEIASSDYDTISLHFRRGDYLTSGFIEPIGEEYYQTAIAMLTKRLDNPYFYIFTDEPEWVKNNFSLDFPNKLVVGNTGKDSYIDILLMSKCKHHIIANSSFSWWGAWLGNHDETITIAPKKWYAFENRDKFTHEITPQNWLRL